MNAATLSRALRPAAALAAILLAAAFGAFIAAPPADPAPAPTATVAADGDEHAGHDHATEDATVWTCSMCPQVRLSEPGKCPICGMDLIPVQAGASGGAQVTLSPEAAALAGLRTVPVERRPASLRVPLVGKVAWDDTRVARITAWFGGRIDRMFVDYAGTRVAKGDHLFELYSPELLVAQQELLQAARDAKRLAGSELMRASIEETLAAARDKLRLWGLQAWQVKQIQDRGRPMERVTIYAPLGGVVTDKAALQGSWVSTGQPIYTIADLSKVWIVLDVPESEVQWIRYGTPLTFEVAAWPGRRYRAEVSFVSPAMDPRTRTVQVRATVDNADQSLKPEMFVRATVHATLGGDGHVGHAHHDLGGRYICPMHPEVTADGPDRCTVCGMKLVPAGEHWLVSASLGRPPGEAGDPLLIPATAPLLTGRRAVVFVEVQGADQPTYLLREVTLGPRAGDAYVVLDGLMEGERVVAEGAFKLDSALQIRGDRSAMSLGIDGDGAQPAASPLEALADALAHPDDPDALLQAVRAAGLDAHLLRGPAAWLARATEPRERAAAQALLARAAARVPKLAVPEPPPPPRREAGFPAALDRLVQDAVVVAAALAADDPAAAKAAAAPLAPAVAQLLAAAGEPLDPALAQAAQALGAGPAELPAQRAAFGRLSAALVPLIDLERPAGVPWQITFCPMVDGDQGAYWLQAPGDVANPYYGAEMLRCGNAVEIGPAEAPPAPGGAAK